jgi:hypothetical protein
MRRKCIVGRRLPRVKFLIQEEFAIRGREKGRGVHVESERNWMVGHEIRDIGMDPRS